MFLLVDTTNGQAIARHDSHKALAALHYIQFANVDAVVLRCGENRQFAKLTAEVLRGIIRQAGALRPETPASYTDLIRLVRSIVEADAADRWLTFPFPAEEVVAQAYQIDVKDTRPMAFAPGATRPTLLTAWHCPPQRSVQRTDSSFWIEFAGGLGTGQLVAGPTSVSDAGVIVRERNPPPRPSQEDTTMAATKKAAKKAAKKPAAPKKPAKPAKPAKAVAAGAQEERNGVKRPKPGGNTAAVWDACDKLYAAKRKKCPTFAEVDKEIGRKAIPTATRRSNYAVWKKFHGITGRVSE